MIAAFDVGITNLAICIINNEEILRWEIINISSDKIQCCKILRTKKQCQKIGHYKDNDGNFYCSSHKSLECKKTNEKDNLYSYGVNMYKALDNISELSKCLNIFIENQPVLKNPSIKSISMLLFSYFINKNPNVQFINATVKLNYKKEETKEILKTSKNKYKTRKELSVKYANEIIDEFKINSIILNNYLESKKKDDLADALLYCYMNKNLLITKA